MNLRPVLIVLGGGVLIYVVYQALNGGSGNVVQSAADDITAAVSGWQSVGEGPTWLPVLNAAETQYGIPTNLLARLAYEESTFRSDVIQGLTSSSTGALGLMQLEPAYFSSVTVPIPFTAADTQNQIAQGAQQLASLYAHFNDWGLALAGYNDGQTNVDAFVAGTRALPQETVNYVAGIITDVPVSTTLQA
jgi:soluble lytic murein transglycosylase-like protein